MRAAADDPRRAGHLRGRCVGAELQSARVHAQQRQPVGEDIVHLPGHRLPRQPLRLLGAQRGLALGPPGPFPQREDELPARSDEHPPADHREQHHRTGHGGYAEGEFGIGAHQCADGHRDQGRHADGGDGPERPVHGDGEQRDQCRPRGAGGDRGQGHQHGGEPGRIPSAQPERGAGQQPQDQIGDQHAVRDPGVVAQVVEHQEPEGHHGETADDVDGPVTDGPAAAVRLRLGAGHGGRQQPRVVMRPLHCRPPLLSAHERQSTVALPAVSGPRRRLRPKTAGPSTFVTASRGRMPPPAIGTPTHGRCGGVGRRESIAA